jgi:hypothetical protein
LTGTELLVKPTLVMGYIKRTKDLMLKLLWGKSAVPRGLYDLDRYFRIHGPIRFAKHREDGLIVAQSTNFLQGTIITHAPTETELETKIKDAILTAFEAPSSYAREAQIHRLDSQSDVYALA